MLPPISDPNVLVGTATSDDAAVYRLTDDVALVQTVDFFPPIVDDPYTYGAVSAANALSDVFAMGGTPLLALNIVAFPDDLPSTVLEAILRGGAEKALEANCPIVGGHTINDSEPKSGLAATRLVKPGKQLANSTARPGDTLILTKPVGSGIITTAAKQQHVEGHVLREAIDQMMTLNKAASEAAVEIAANACTDISGFGVIGHLREMMAGSQTNARINYSKIPLMSGAWELASEHGIYPAGMTRNREHHDDHVEWNPEVHPLAHRVLYDPQTSGGLLLSVSRDKRDALLTTLGANGISHASVIGEVTEQGNGTVQVCP